LTFQPVSEALLGDREALVGHGEALLGDREALVGRGEALFDDREALVGREKPFSMIEKPLSSVWILHRLPPAHNFFNNGSIPFQFSFPSQPGESFSSSSSSLFSKYLPKN
jgi:hypothetical protein